MMDRSDFPASIRVDLAIKFNEGFRAKESDAWRQLVEIVPTTSNAKEEVFYGQKPLLRRWRGERQPQKFNEYKMNMTTDQWELTYSWKRKDLNNDQGKRLMALTMNFANEVALTREIKFWQFLRNGSSIKGFDKANLYDFNHIYTDTSGATYGSVQSNMHLGGSQLDTTTIQIARQRYAEVETDKPGIKWGLRLTDVAVYDGSINHKNALEIANSQFTVDASTVRGQMTNNVFQGSFNIMTTNYGIGASEWITFSTTEPQFKPVKVLSETVNPGFDSPRFSSIGFDGDESDSSFWRGEISVGVEMNYDYNPGYWFTTFLNGSSSYVFTPVDNEDQRVSYPNL
jgi:hypothetical protein